MNYNPVASRIAAKLSRFGETMTLRRGAESHSCVGIRTQFDSREADGTLIRVSDAKVIIAASGLAIIPTTTDKLRFPGQTVDRVIAAVRTLGPTTSTPLAFILAVR